jgi:3-dehydroquinate dehydratase type I
LDSLQSSGVKILLSHHAFGPEDPAVWESRLEEMRAFNPDGVKFAVFVHQDQDILGLLKLARKVGAEFPDSCVLGMGETAVSTRLISPLLGCRYTYGYLGQGPVAPGQLSVEIMRAFFDSASRTDAGRPALEAPTEEWLRWADTLLKGF